MSWLDRRSAVLAENIANADTPGWQSRDLKPFSAALALAQAGAGAGGTTPVRTSPLHLAGISASDPALQVLAGERAPDGNAVRLDAELTKVANTDSAHLLVSNLWKTWLGMFRTALGR